MGVYAIVALAAVLLTAGVGQAQVNTRKPTNTMPADEYSERSRSTRTQ